MKRTPQRPDLVPISWPKRVMELTDRERSVLQQYAGGSTYKAAGKVLGISPKTVGAYLQRIREKFRLKSRKDFVELATKEGLFNKPK